MKRSSFGADVVLPLIILCSMGVPMRSAEVKEAITFDKDFEGASLGRIEKLSDTVFRCRVEGQSDEHGRNRQATWYFFRMDHVAGRDITLTLTDFVGEYNFKPGVCPMNANLRPMFSWDGEQWQHFESMAWDDTKKEATLRFTPTRDTIWIAHLEPYTHTRLLGLLDELRRDANVRIEVVGKTAQNRDLHAVTITNVKTPDANKKTVWLQARQHAWETGTSFVMEGTLRILTSDDARARELLDRVIFKFTPMMDPDGASTGKVRFNANGYDLNRHWDEVDLRNKEWLARTPEIWHVKRAVFDHVDSGKEIGLFLNLHNDETPEYLGTMVDDPVIMERLKRFEKNLGTLTTFDGSRSLAIASSRSTTTNCLWKERRIPVVLMEQRIGPNKKLNRRLTASDRLQFGRQLIIVMADTVLERQ